MRVNENEMSMRWNHKAWSVLECGLQRYHSWDSSWCSYVKPDLKLRGISAASTIRPTRALHTIVTMFSQKEWQGPARPVHHSGPARLPFLYFRPGPARLARPMQGSNRNVILVKLPSCDMTFKAWSIVFDTNFSWYEPVVTSVYRLSAREWW